MDSKEEVVVNIINRNYPPGPGITGESANELAGFLIAHSIKVNVVHVNAFYEGNANNTNANGVIHTIKTFYNGKNKFLRLFANLYEGWALIKKSKSLKPDVTVCLTDPPLLNMWASLLLNSKHPWILWAMDLYPEAFVAGGLITKGNIFFKQINKILLKNPPLHIIALGPCQAEYLKLKYSSAVSVSILPCGIYNIKEDNSLAEIPQWATDNTKIYLGYCGNLGEAHSLSFLYKIIDNIDTDKFALILSVYGSNAKELLAYANNKPGVKVLPGVKKSDLKYIDVHLASLKKNWVNVCVPSKTVSSVCAGSAFIYLGIAQSDNWQLLHDAGWLINYAGVEKDDIKVFLQQLTKEAVILKQAKAIEIAGDLVNNRQHAFEEIIKKIYATKEPVHSLATGYQPGNLKYLKPRLLIFTNRLVVGGISNDIIPLAYYLKDSFDILIICGETEKGEATASFILERYSGLTIKKIKEFKKNFNPVRDCISFLKIKKTIKEFHPDIVHTHGAKSGFLGRLAAYQSGVPCIIHTFHGHHFHSYYNRRLSDILIKMERWIARRSTKIIITSEHQRHDLIDQYKIVSSEKIISIPLGIDQERFFETDCKEVKAFREKFNPENYISIGIIARITEVKNFDLFITVADKLLKTTEHPVRFFIIGDGILKKNIQQKLSAKQIDWCNAENFTGHADIVFTSWIANVADVISMLDIVMLTSNNEGTAFSLVEAQLCGKPVVATNVGGVIDTVINGQTGFLVEANDADAMVEKLKELIDNPELRKSMGKEAAMFAAKNFSKQREVENYKQLYTSLLAQHVV